MTQPIKVTINVNDVLAKRPDIKAQIIEQVRPSLVQAALDKGFTPEEAEDAANAGLAHLGLS